MPLGADEQTFAFLSGGGATWKPSFFTPMFGRVKGDVERQLAAMDSKSFRVYSFRAGARTLLRWR